VNEQGAFSIIDVYLRLAETHKLSYYNHSYDYWADLGKVPQLEQLQAEVSEKGFFWI
jgi:NDP-sugar pyrophosphorylase family protein